MNDERRYSITEILGAATKANHIIGQWVPQTWIDGLLKSLRELPDTARDGQVQL